MSDESSYPAALPLLLFSAGLLVSPQLTAPGAVVWLLLLSAALTLCLSSRRRFRFALLLATLSLSIWTGERRLQSAQLDRTLVARAGASRFAGIEAPFSGSWIPLDGGGFALRADHFLLLGERHRVRAPLIIYLYGNPPAAPECSTIRVFGFLRPDEHGGYRVQVKSPRLIRCETEQPHWWAPQDWNRSLSRRLDAIAVRNPALGSGAALAEALALGRKERLSQRVRSSYQRAGTYHLLVFSGMQIAVVAAFLSALLGFLARPRITDGILLALALLAPPFAGGDASVERCGWMIGLFAVSRMAHRPTLTGNLLFVSALIRLIAHPEELGEAGFALTYAATAGLIFIGKPMAGRFRNRVCKALAFGLGAEIATIPLTLFFFHQAVLGSSLLTLLLAPLFTIMLAGSVAAVAMTGLNLTVVSLLLRGIDAVNTACCYVNGLVEVVPLSVMAAAPPLSLLLTVYSACLLIMAMPGRQARPLLMSLILLSVPCVVFVGSHARSSVQAPQIEFLDVGQGDAILIRSGSRAMLIDAGPPPRGSALRANALVSMLLDRGVRHLSAVAVTHPHPDHCGGVPDVVTRLKVDQVWVAGRHLRSPCGASILEAIENRQTALVLAGRPATTQFGFVTVESLTAQGRFRRSAENNSSVLYRVQVGSRRALLTGDIEKERERELVADDNGERVGWLGADILKVAHHGSASSSTAPFLEAVGPRIAVVSCGRGNRFGHPGEKVVQALRSRGIRCYRTDRSGSVLLRFSGNHLFVTPEIDTSRPGT